MPIDIERALQSCYQTLTHIRDVVGADCGCPHPAFSKYHQYPSALYNERVFYVKSSTTLSTSLPQDTILTQMPSSTLKTSLIPTLDGAKVGYESA